MLKKGKIVSVDSEKDIVLSREELQADTAHFVDKLNNKELKRVFIKSNDEIEAVILNIDDYEYLKKDMMMYEAYRASVREV